MVYPFMAAAISLTCIRKHRVTVQPDHIIIYSGKKIQNSHQGYAWSFTWPLTLLGNGWFLTVMVTSSLPRAVHSQMLWKAFKAAAAM